MSMREPDELGKWCHRLVPVVLLALGVPLLAACGWARQAGGAAAASPRHGAAGAAKEVEIQEDPVKTGIEAGDAGLASQVRSRLAGDPELRKLRIEVDAEGGRVTLWGHVDQAAQREAAERLARRTPRVAEVIDLIKVGDQGPGSR
jgi:osmotically-inducible protein OsmY